MHVNSQFTAKPQTTFEVGRKDFRDGNPKILPLVDRASLSSCRFLHGVVVVARRVPFDMRRMNNVELIELFVAQRV